MAEKKNAYTGQTDARRQASAKYLKESVEDIRIRVPKGRKAEIKEHAEKYQEESGVAGAAGYTPKGSVNAFIICAIDEKMERDKKTSTQSE